MEPVYVNGDYCRNGKSEIVFVLVDDDGDTNEFRLVDGKMVRVTDDD